MWLKSNYFVMRIFVGLKFGVSVVAPPCGVLSSTWKWGVARGLFHKGVGSGWRATGEDVSMHSFGLSSHPGESLWSSSLWWGLCEFIELHLTLAVLVHPSCVLVEFITLCELYSGGVLVKSTRVAPHSTLWVDLSCILVEFITLAGSL